MNSAVGSRSILNKKLAGYTLLGTAAFTVTGKAHAGTITYASVGQTFTANNSNGSSDYVLSLGNGSIDLNAYAPYYQEISFTTAGSGFYVLMDPSNTDWPLALSAAQTIDPSTGLWGNPASTGSGSGDPLAEQYYANKGDFPQNGDSAYLAFYFTENDGTHAGWINLNTALDTNNNVATFTVNSYAYDNTPYESITAGQGTPSGPAVTPEPSTLSLLMLGSAGLLEVRRRRQKVN